MAKVSRATRAAGNGLSTQVAAAPIVDNDIVFLRKIAEKAVSGQMGVDLLTTLIDTKALIEKSGVPVNEDASTADMMDELIRQEEERAAREEAAANSVPPIPPAGQSGHEDESSHNTGHEPVGQGGK